MKRIKCIIIIASVLISVCACKMMPASRKDGVSQIADSTFQATVVNNSFFTVIIDEKTIKKGESIKNTFPLRDSELYDGWGVSYKIPLSKDVFYVHREKVQVINNQKTVTIASPSKNNIREAYIVVKNTSKQSMRLGNGNKASTFFACSLEGRVNTMDAKKEHNIAPSKTAVYEISTQEVIRKSAVFVFQGKKNYPLLENTSLKQGYVYTYEFNGEEAVKIDERPILKVGEPLWKADDASISIEKVLTSGNIFYVTGKKKVVDPDGNVYYCPYISCIDGANNLQWKTEESSIDGYIQDAFLLEDKSILACGQSAVDGKNIGSLWLYSSDGILQSSKNYSDLQVLSNLAHVDDGVVVAGFDNEGNLSLSKVAISKGAISHSKKPVALLPSEIVESTTSVSLLYEPARKTLFLFCNLTNEDGDVLPSKLFAIKEGSKGEEISLSGKIASVSSAIQSSTGVIYACGESTIDEKTESVVLKIEADKDAKVRTASVFYQGSTPFSYITSISLDESSKTLTAGGVCKAKESTGVGGHPFMANFDIVSGKNLIYREYKNTKKQLLRSFAPAFDYGFIACFSSVIQDGDSVFLGQSLLARMNGTGEMRDK